MSNIDLNDLLAKVAASAKQVNILTGDHASAPFYEAGAGPTYNYEAGSTHDDKRQQLSIGEVEEKKVQLKRIANE